MKARQRHQKRVCVVPAIIVCLWAAWPIAAQDLFNSNAGDSPCVQAITRVQQTHAANMAVLQRKEAALREQYDQERSACGFAEPCLTAATRKDAERHRKLELEREDERDRFRKARIDAEHSDACMEPAPDGPPPRGAIHPLDFPVCLRPFGPIAALTLRQGRAHQRLQPVAGVQVPVTAVG